LALRSPLIPLVNSPRGLVQSSLGHRKNGCAMDYKMSEWPQGKAFSKVLGKAFHAALGPVGPVHIQHSRGAIGDLNSLESVTPVRPLDASACAVAAMGPGERWPRRGRLWLPRIDDIFRARSLNHYELVELGFDIRRNLRGRMGGQNRQVRSRIAGRAHLGCESIGGRVVENTCRWMRAGFGLGLPSPEFPLGRVFWVAILECAQPLSG